MNIITRYRRAIAILSVLLTVSVGLLVVQTVRKLQPSTGESTVSGSIGATEEHWNFSAEGMLPGDSAAKDFTLKVQSPAASVLCFAVTASADDRSLSRVLRVKVENTTTGATVCDGLLSEIAGQEFPETISGRAEQSFTYKITVTLDTSAGNEYAGASVRLGFRWSLAVKEGEEA